MAKNTRAGHRKGIIRNRYQKLNPISGLWDKYTTAGHYVGTKKSGGPFKAIIKLVGRNPRRGKH